MERSTSSLCELESTCSYNDGELMFSKTEERLFEVQGDGRGSRSTFGLPG